LYNLFHEMEFDSVPLIDAILHEANIVNSLKDKISLDEHAKLIRLLDSK
jgi:hypothetical protein